MIFEQPVRYEHVFDINFLDEDRELISKIYMLSREGIVKAAIDEYREQQQATSRHMLAAVIISEAVLGAIRRELRRSTPNLKVGADEIKDVLTRDVLKRDIFEGDELAEAQRRVKKGSARPIRRRRKAEPGPEKVDRGAEVGTSARPVSGRSDGE
jgi:hypothetical protein